MYKSDSDINNIIIKNSFNTADIEQLITRCNYEPFYDEPDSIELIQLAAYDKRQLNNATALTNSLIGFISCIVPEFLYESYDNDMDCHEDDTIEIEITAIVSPEYRKQGIFTELFLALKQYISKQCTLKHRKLPDITYIAANMRRQEGMKEACDMIYVHSDYLMSLTPKSTDITYTMMRNNAYKLIKDEDIFELIDTSSDTIVTSISYCSYENSICIYDVWTNPDYRRSGCAKYLLSVMINELAFNTNNSHIKSFILHVSSKNTAAVSLYTSIGFIVEQEIKYYRLK